MIQRIQSIWLLLAAITILCLLFVPVFTANSGETHYTLYGSGLKWRGSDVRDSSTNLPLAISTILAGLISLINIFNFRNRSLQKRIASLNIILILGLSFWLSQLGRQIPGGLEKATIGAGLFLPLIAIIFTLLAIKGIKSDDQLIRSADRLR
jgi:Domain of unknown function (DUF4293)